jgi:ubiquinol-cytochrome c reductase cytochrome b subunit
MFKRLADWLDHRTGYRRLISALLIEHIPGGAKWRYIWGSTLAFVFLIQVVTGVLLMTAYSAGDSTAWSSVYFIQYQMDFGWFIRGLHHFGSATMVVLLGLHMLQVVIAGAHLPPREINWWLGLVLLGLVMAMSLTGYLLPWDQKGYWATQVATNIMGSQPVIGPWMQKVVVGGPGYGHHTLTRFYALHVGILPPLMIVLIIAHLVVFRRHGVTVPYVTIPRDEAGEPLPAKGDGWFWPDQAFRDMLVSMAIFAVLIGLVVWGHGHAIDAPPESEEPASLYERWAHAGREGRGANLDAPADPSKPYPARPEWYYLFLFQVLKYFEGPRELIGTAVIPFGTLIVLGLLPLLGYGRMRKFGHVAGVLVVIGVLGSVGVLTALALYDDRPPANLSDEEVAKLPDAERASHEKRKLFHEELAAANASAHRAIQLAPQGIPAEGAVWLLRRDPMTEGKRLFGRHCATCHTHGDDFHDSEEEKAKATASDLNGFGTKEWIVGLLRDPGKPEYFGRTKLTTMARWVERTRKRAAKDGKEKEVDADFDLIAEWLATHPREELPNPEEKGPEERPFLERVALAVGKYDCTSCHTYLGSGGGTAPDLTGYGDASWVRLMVVSPADPLRYGERNTMPAFLDLEGVTADITRMHMDRMKMKFLELVPADDEKEADAKRKQIEEATHMAHLTEVERELIIRYLLKDGRVVFGGTPVTAPPKR